MTISKNKRDLSEGIQIVEEQKEKLEKEKAEFEKEKEQILQNMRKQQSKLEEYEKILQSREITLQHMEQTIQTKQQMSNESINNSVQNYMIQQKQDELNVFFTYTLFHFIVLMNRYYQTL